MCGICGMVLKAGEAVDQESLWRMNRTLIPRGPDEQQVYVDRHLGLGHCRLSIIDLSGGRQPMASRDGRWRLVYNGEVYNYVEIRRELEELGESFRTTSDTEVILTAFQRWGDKAFSRFDGMFALAIWDSREQELILARDRFGIKPLYYVEHQGRFAFASEIKALLQLSWWERDIDPLAVDEYFSYLVVPEPRTIYRAVRAFPPAHWGRLQSGKLEVFPYWQPEIAPRPLTLPEACEGLDAALRRAVKVCLRSDVPVGAEALRRAVKVCLRSDVPVGAFLSGGLDSGGVVSYAAEMSPRQLKTFSVGFSDEPSYNELPLAQAIARQWRTEHYELDCRLDTLEVPTLAQRVISACDQPFADYSSLVQLVVAEFASRHVKTILSGDGGDEVLGGYPTVYAPSLARLYRQIPAFLRLGVLAPLVRALPTSMNRISFDYMAKRFVRGAELDLERAHFAWKEAVFIEDKPRLYTREFWQDLKGHDAFGPLALAFARSSAADPVNRLLFADQQTFLLNDNLPKVDRTSMAVSLEVRLPLLTNTVVDFLLQVPPDLKVRLFQTKYLFRRVLAPRLPKKVVRGKKKGFTPPMSAWLRTNLYAWARETLLSPNFLAL
ncbi:MAG: asparagine synthase (glutamine-hydrolyzing), partial [Deltaproteobacteria bacterium]|nr:asparagine synthase (glutamine-hydrolyzing) [Deltaproteobacteria bacterium]